MSQFDRPTASKPLPESLAGDLAEFASAADLKFLHNRLRIHVQELQIESGTGVIKFSVPFVSEVRL